MYVLVLLAHQSEVAATIDHESFIDGLIAANQILLGGGFDEPIVGADAAYVLRCSDLAAAQRIVATDPLVSSGASTAALTGWDLVGINVDAIDVATSVD